MTALFAPNHFANRHIGLNADTQNELLKFLDYKNLKAFTKAVIPENLFAETSFKLSSGLTEFEALNKLKKYANKNKLMHNLIGLGYHETITPSVILRNVLENPGWYTAYTPYQAEIAQGRLELLLNFQQMIMDLTGFNLANAALLDEATAAAEAMSMARRLSDKTTNKFFVDDKVLPQTITVIQTRAEYQDIEVIVGKTELALSGDYFGALFQYPNIEGNVSDFKKILSELKTKNIFCILACDLLALTLLTPPAELGADIAVGNTQRFGVPMGFGGPHAAFFATKDEYKRSMPGRIIGVTVDRRGNKALRMALQTREQHIRREKATSNICTSQVLLANMAALYAMYHGREGLQFIAKHVHALAKTFKESLVQAGVNVLTNAQFFDTIAVQVENADAILTACAKQGFNIAKLSEQIVAVSFAETSTLKDLVKLLKGLTPSSVASRQRRTQGEKGGMTAMPTLKNLKDRYEILLQENNQFRTDNFLSHPNFNVHQTETQMMRYLKKLENKDLSLVHSMIPLGSCTMKLNAASELMPLSWQHMANMHPFAPTDQAQGYLTMIEEFKNYLCAITGFDDVYIQPNSGAQGEYAGLLAIRNFHKAQGEAHRNICLIPKSAHGTNPATAQMCGMEVIVVNCDDKGNIDVADLKKQAQEHQNNLAALMVTYPSTHGVFEASIKEVCAIVHQHGGQVYMDGANLNALVGLVKPAELGADVSHMNLHKTFSIPHGGGGPGMGPIGVKAHLIAHLPKAVSAAPFGSSLILNISWMYITMMGKEGLTQATQSALLNANYLAQRLKDYFPVLYTGQNERVAHECIIDLRPLKAETGITEVDIAKRLMDYGFHAPTMSFPVAGTLMIEPTESEDKRELDRFANALIAIHAEIMKVKNGQYDKTNNPLKNAPHTQKDVIDWQFPYSIQEACYPLPYVLEAKVWPSANRVDDVSGDRMLVCACPPMENYSD
jgi:glycine dehydrogenase